MNLQPAEGPAPPGVLVLGECLVDLAPAPAGAMPGEGGPRDDSRPSPARAGGPGQPGHADGRAGGPDEPDGADASAGPPGRPFVAMPGGGPANIAVGLARLGTRTAFAGRFSRSGFGPWLRRNLADNGVDLTFSVDATEAATLAVVTLDSQARASYTFYGPGTADWQWSADELPGAGPVALEQHGVIAVHTGSLATAFEPGASAIYQWLQSLHRGGKVLISLDPNVRPALVGDVTSYRDRLEGMVSNSHIVKASDEDIGAIYPGAELMDVAGQWLSAGVGLVVVTEGAKGATAVHARGGRVHCAPPAVTVKDTIGAGDSFTSGLLAYLAANDLLTPVAINRLDEAQLEAALEQSVTASAFTCTRWGADPPTKAELAAFRHRSSGFQ